jgi:hypothetical protein
MYLARDLTDILIYYRTDLDRQADKSPSVNTKSHTFVDPQSGNLTFDCRHCSILLGCYRYKILTISVAVDRHTRVNKLDYSGIQ